MSLVSQLQLVMSRIGAEFKSVRTAVAAKADKTTTVTAGAGLSGGGDLSASRTLNVVYGTVVGTAAQGNDSRLSDARTPTAHNHDASAIVSGTLADARLPARIGIYGVGITDWNTVVQNGFWMAAGAANAPSTDGSWWKGIAIVHNDLWITQLVGQFTDTSTTQSWFMRHSQDSGGTRLWGPWHRVQLTQASQDARYVQLTDARLTDARTPTTHTHDDRYYTETEINNNYYTRAQSDAGYVSVARAITAGTGLTGGGTLAADRSLAVSYGTTAGTAAQGNDSRLSDARTPTTHQHAATDITSGTLPDARLPGRLGTAPLFVTEWNNAQSSGWYYSQNGASNAPSYPYVGNPPTWVGEVNNGNGQIVQTLTRSYGNDNDTVTFQRRYDTNTGIWGAWYKLLQSATEIQAQGDALYTSKITGTATRDTTVRHVKMATTANITLSGGQTIDNVAVTNNCRILVKNQTNAAQNGVYVGNTFGSWVRTNDLDTSEEWNNLAPSSVVHISVQEGSQAGTDWIAKFPNTSVIGVDPLTFSPVSAVASSSIVRATEGPTNFAANTWYQITGLAIAGQQGGAISFAGGVYTINVTGWYRLSAQSFFTVYNAARYILRVVSGTNPDLNILIADEDGGAGQALPVLNASGTVYLTAGTTIRLFLYCTSATTTDAKSLTIEALDNARVGTTPVLSDTGWLDLPMSAGWRAYAAGYDTPQYRKVGNTVHIKGFIAGGTTTIGTIVATLPSGFRPIDISHIVHTDAANSVARLNVYPDGTIRINSGWNSTWTTFGYISFPVDAAATGVALTDTGWLPMTLTGGMAWWGTGWQVPAYRKVGNLVRLRGLVNSGSTPTATFWQAPPGFFSTTGSSMWGTRMGDGSVRRTDLSALGSMSMPEGATASTFFPLDHMQWYTD